MLQFTIFMSLSVHPQNNSASVIRFNILIPGVETRAYENIGTKNIQKFNLLLTFCVTRFVSTCVTCFFLNKELNLNECSDEIVVCLHRQNRTEEVVGFVLKLKVTTL